MIIPPEITLDRTALLCFSMMLLPVLFTYSGLDLDQAGPAIEDPELGQPQKTLSASHNSSLLVLLRALNLIMLLRNNNILSLFSFISFLLSFLLLISPTFSLLLTKSTYAAQTALEFPT